MRAAIGLVAVLRASPLLLADRIPIVFVLMKMAYKEQTYFSQISMEIVVVPLKEGLSPERRLIDSLFCYCLPLFCGNLIFALRDGRIENRVQNALMGALDKPVFMRRHVEIYTA